MASLLSVNVGMPKDVAWQGRTVHTGIFKSSVNGSVMVRKLNIDGDGQGDLNGHGGEQRAVLVYQLDSIRYWQRYFGHTGFEFGQFGENFTVAGLSDQDVCIGDRYRIGEAEFEVTQPRVTCFRVGMRLGVPTLAALLVAHHRPGFYFRVITEGRVQAGDRITRTRRGAHRMSVAAIDGLLYLPDRDPNDLEAALDIPALSPGWRQSFRELLTSERPDAPPLGVEPSWSGFRAMRVVDIVRESSTISSVYLAAADGARLPAALPGQYLTLRFPGAGDPAPVRSYSLSSAPGSDTYRISVKREGLVSSYVHTRLRTDAIVAVAAPRGDFVLTAGTEPVLLVSAGVGVTPVLAMLHHLAAQRSDRDVWWLHTAHNSDEQAFADEAHQLLRSLPTTHEHVFHTAPAAGIRSDRLTAESLATLGLPSEATAYLCGPQRFMTDIGEALTALGIPRIHTELFGTRTPINPGVTALSSTPPHQPPGTPGTGPMITFGRSGLSTRWQIDTGSLLELAEACDVPTRWSCRTGVCHTCITPLLAGATSYLPDPLEAPDNGQVLICCARPDSDVVLDL
ncbi:MOSC and FAD-binding oxidoreductase domain-containing protein [Nocardia jiangxiensis]|uniref:MOSC and FAD-binding oxidoreductase domain-containing protein n=1 Tax=Nocardia jiangxiensis TaxID=282685 RepID=UPI000317C123|nr:MOSC and FAD-binding oxidoreductase domain-containing protein [Nocardia jiangxiensis]